MGGWMIRLADEIYSKLDWLRKCGSRHDISNSNTCKKLVIRICIMQSEDLIFMAILIF